MSLGLTSADTMQLVSVYIVLAVVITIFKPLENSKGVSKISNRNRSGVTINPGSQLKKKLSCSRIELKLCNKTEIR